MCFFKPPTRFEVVKTDSPSFYNVATAPFILVELTCKSIRIKAEFEAELTLKFVQDCLILLELTRKSVLRVKQLTLKLVRVSIILAEN